MTGPEFSNLLGWVPRDELGFAAMCNAPQDHRVLGELCMAVAKHVDGLIDFCGQIAVGPSLCQDRPTDPVRVDDPEGLRGTMMARSYPVFTGYATRHYGDPTFMKSWLLDDRFRMVK